MNKSVQRSYNLSKIVVYPKTKSSILFWVQEMNIRNLGNNMIQPIQPAARKTVNKAMLLVSSSMQVVSNNTGDPNTGHPKSGFI